MFPTPKVQLLQTFSERIFQVTQSVFQLSHRFSRLVRAKGNESKHPFQVFPFGLWEIRGSFPDVLG